MSRHQPLRALAAVCCLLLGLAACSPNTPREPVADTTPAEQPQARQPHASPVAADFTPPDAQGWGQAAGLRYLEVLRGDADPNQALPMLVMIHGLGDMPRPEWFMGMGVAARIVLPQAPTPYRGGYSWFAYRVHGGDSGELARGITTATTQLAEALRVLVAQRPTRGRPVVAGFSQGGMLSYALSLQHPHLVGQALPLCGMLPRELWPKQGPGVDSPSILGFHGDADAVVPIAGDRALVAHLQQLGYPVELREFEGVGHQLEPPMGDAVYGAVSAALAKVEK